MGFLGDSDSKESACNVGDLGLIPGLGRSPGGEQGNSLQYSCLESPLGQRSLAGYSPQCLKERLGTNQVNNTFCLYLKSFKLFLIYYNKWDSPGKSTGVGCHFLLQGITKFTPP